MIWFITFCSRGTLKPRDHDLKEYWTWKPAGPTDQQPWALRVLHSARFWRGGDDRRRRSDTDAEAGSSGSCSGSSLKTATLTRVVSEPVIHHGLDTEAEAATKLPMPMSRPFRALP